MRKIETFPGCSNPICIFIYISANRNSKHSGLQNAEKVYPGIDVRDKDPRQETEVQMRTDSPFRFYSLRMTGE